MSTSLPLEVQQRLRILYRYVQALEQGDLENVASLWRMAEQDVVLDRMFQEIDLLYQIQDLMTVQSDELAELHERLAHLHRQESETMQVQPDGMRTWVPQTHPVPLPQESRQTSMQYQSTPFIPEEREEERGMSQAQPPFRRKNSTRFLQKLAVALAAVLIVGGFVGTLLARQYLMTSTSVEHSGSTSVFQGGPYLIQANEDGAGLENASATIMIPNVNLAPSWSYSLTMTQVQESATPQYGSSFGLILAYTKEYAYAVSFSDNQGKPSVRMFNYNWNMIHQNYHNGQYDSPPYINQVTPIPGGVHVWKNPNPIPFHTGLNVTNTVKITATGHTMTILVNGTSVGTIQNITVSRGQFGMFVDTKGTVVKFQNVQITQF